MALVIVFVHNHHPLFAVSLDPLPLRRGRPYKHALAFRNNNFRLPLVAAAHKGHSSASVGVDGSRPAAAAIFRRLVVDVVCIAPPGSEAEDA